MTARHVWVYPARDMVAHDVESDDCICGPSTEYGEFGVMLTHHSLDGREAIEELPIWGIIFLWFRRMFFGGGYWVTRWEVID